MASCSSICHPNQKDILSYLIEEISGGLLLYLNPFIREGKQAGDVYCSLAADKLRIIITGVCNTRCQVSTIQELDVETFHICIEEAQADQRNRTENNSCLIAKAMRDAYAPKQVLWWSSLVWI
jgi:hypothetical protein